eukprot:Rhum_TRINITY_DN13819_c1_g1::Rhum_TRINITY_DN13819_c1_g1_i1::g.64765::m.64765
MASGERPRLRLEVWWWWWVDGAATWWGKPALRPLLQSGPRGTSPHSVQTSGMLARFFFFFFFLFYLFFFLRYFFGSRKRNGYNRGGGNAQGKCVYNIQSRGGGK